MKALNTLPIEEFLDKARIAIKSNQKNLSLSLQEVTALQNSLTIVMTRLAGELDEHLQNSQQPSKIEIKMDGGKF